MLIACAMFFAMKHTPARPGVFSPRPPLSLEKWPSFPLPKTRAGVTNVSLRRALTFTMVLLTSKVVRGTNKSCGRAREEEGHLRKRVS